MIPGVADPDRWVEALNPGAQGIDSAPLMAVSRVSFVFAPPDDLLLDTLEDKMEDITINVGRSAVRARDGFKLLKACFGSNFVMFVLGKSQKEK